MGGGVHVCVFVHTLVHAFLCVPPYPASSAAQGITTALSCFISSFIGFIFALTKPALCFQLAFLLFFLYLSLCVWLFYFNCCSFFSFFLCNPNSAKCISSPFSHFHSSFLSHFVAEFIDLRHLIFLPLILCFFPFLLLPCDCQQPACLTRSLCLYFQDAFVVCSSSHSSSREEPVIPAHHCFQPPLTSDSATH